MLTAKEETLKRRRSKCNLVQNVETSNIVHDVSVSEDKKQVEVIKTTLKDDNNNFEDVYTKLSNAEYNLALATEVSEALLTENIEVKKKYDSLLEEHALQVEALQQEKHEIDQRRQRVESIQEDRIRELSEDLDNLQNALNVFEASSLDDRETRRIAMYELIEENSKLKSDLLKTKSSNENLLKEIKTLKSLQQGGNLNESLDSGTFSQADILQQKLSVLEDQKEKLNLSLNQMLAEKNDMDVEVNVLTKKIISLTKELADCKCEMFLCEEELRICKKENLKLNEELEEAKLQTSQQTALNGSSIFSEISVLENENEFNRKLATSSSIKKLNTVESLQGAPSPLAASSSANLLNKLNESERTRLDNFYESSYDGNSSTEEDNDNFVLTQRGYFAKYEEEQKINVELRREMCNVAHQLLNACRLITDDDYKSKQTIKMEIDELFSIEHSSIGTLTMIAAEMNGLLKEYREKKKENTDAMKNHANDDIVALENKIRSLEGQVEDLTTECFEAKKQLSSLGVELEEARNDLLKCEAEKKHLLNKIAAERTELETLKTKYAYIKSCRSRSVVEELEKARRDVQRLDTQLITAINQKVRLSEQLEQWQFDMAYVIENQVKRQTDTNAEHNKKKSRLPFMKKGWMWSS
ncbi:bicaudal D-related protein homolog [Xenia sp. Carnegie-2017]|uniref:bicaudal D-related protein homolog n=1 Tax=Xenia sp. Carnegie-2017 TaxID=2897299 RepID=UPI001F049CEB|nr:bicaudal D-related protein homolog [Xenia sp. Carnegie-2017]XP_046840581.1 bicaudal D-related protein homolog [Xenia sp. Carnegie-2017]XP_046840583.1 bicaudal D-related protein homolog [Xenia sp. Carnegie-2017]